MKLQRLVKIPSRKAKVFYAYLRERRPTGDTRSTFESSKPYFQADNGFISRKKLGVAAQLAETSTAKRSQYAIDCN